MNLSTIYRLFKPNLVIQCEANTQMLIRDNKFIDEHAPLRQYVEFAVEVWLDKKYLR